MTVHEALGVFTFGFLVGGAVIGVAAYRLATHLGQLRSEVAGVAGHLAGAQAASAIARGLTVPAGVTADLAPTTPIATTTPST